MKIKRILISQPVPQSESSPYKELEQKYGLTIEFRQFIKVEGLTVSEYRKQKLNLLDFTGVIMNSKMAVDNYFRLAEEMRVTIPATMKFFCVTEAVAYYLQKYITFRKRKIFFGERSLDDVMELMKKHADENYLMPISSVHQPSALAKMKKAKFKVTPTIMYKTVSAVLSDIPDVAVYDVLVFFTPAGIQSLLENFPNFNQEKTAIACFGPSTAKAIKAAKLKLDFKAPTKEAPSMIMALENYVKAQLKKAGTE